MLAFAVADAAQSSSTSPASPGKLWRQAYVIGKEDLPVPGVITPDSAGTQVVCRKSIPGAAAMAVQVDCGKHGVLNLRTCLLPDRDKPYILNLELARRRIMLLINKIEEWGWSDLPASDPVMAGLDRSRELFTAALVAADAAEQCRLARESLLTALEAGETLAIREADRALTKRLATNDKPLFGVATHADQFSEQLQKTIAGNVDFIRVPLRWNRIEADEGRFDFTKMDRWVEWAVRNGKVPVVAGPVIDLSPRGCPRWLHVWNHDYETLREFAYEHAKRVVTRYRRTVSRWVVSAGMNLNTGFTLSMEQMIDLTRVAVMTVRKLHPSAPVYAEISEPFGEHASANTQSVAPLLYAELLLGSGVQIDGFALAVQMGGPRHADSAARPTRDLLELSAMLDTYAEFDRPLIITSLGCPSDGNSASRPPGTAAPNGATTTHQDSGHWRGPWTPESQAAWMSHAAAVCLSKSQVKSVCWQALFDTPDGPDMPHGGLITADGRPKPGLTRLAEITKALRAGKTPPM
ncbi:MAG: endo-1,4-beta-xylanase [Phycisphaerales bacterium]